MAFGPCFLFLLEGTSGHLNSKGFRRNLILMTRATQKEQATTSLKTNLLNVDHVEYKQDSRRFYKQTEKCKHAEFSPFKILALLRFRQFVHFLCRARDDFSNSFALSILNGYSFSVKYHCMVRWTLLSAGTLFHFFCVCSEKILTKGGQTPT